MFLLVASKWLNVKCTGPIPLLVSLSVLSLLESYRHSVQVLRIRNIDIRKLRELYQSQGSSAATGGGSLQSLEGSAVSICQH